MDAQRFGESVRRRRAQVGMTQEGLAQASGLTFGTVNEIENGKREPQLKTAIAIATALGTQLDDLLSEHTHCPPGTGDAA